MPTQQITVACEKLQEKIMAQLSEVTKVDIGIIDNPEIATYAAYQEYGWVQSVTAKQQGWFGRQLGNGPREGSQLTLPPRPFLRGTMAAEMKKWKHIYTQAFRTYGTERAADALSMLGIKAAEDIRETLIRGGTSKETFERRSELTQRLYEKQAEGHNTDGTGNIQGDKPLVKTGALLNAIGYQLS